MLDFIPNCLTLPDTPIWRTIAVIGCLWILTAVFFPVIFGLLVFAVVVGIGSLIAGGIVTIIRSFLG